MTHFRAKYPADKYTTLQYFLLNSPIKHQNVKIHRSPRTNRPSALAGPAPNNPSPIHRQPQPRTNPLRTPLRQQNDQIPKPTKPLRKRNAPTRHPRPTPPAVGSPPRLIPEDQTGVLQLAKPFSKTAGRDRTGDLCGEWV